MNSIFNNMNLFQTMMQQPMPFSMLNNNTEELYDIQLAQMESLGYSNRQLNLQALQVSNGNIDAAIHYIINSNRNNNNNNNNDNNNNNNNDKKQ